MATLRDKMFSFSTICGNIGLIRSDERNMTDLVSVDPDFREERKRSIKGISIQTRIPRMRCSASWFQPFEIGSSSPLQVPRPACSSEDTASSDHSFILGQHGNLETTLYQRVLSERKRS